MASRGLSRGSDDPELIALLLRQLYLVRMEEQNYAEALLLASEMVDLEELGDIARQDAARAAVGLSDYETAIGHLRIASRISPADRRAFHLATLGALLRLAGRAREAAATLGKATRWAQKDRALYRAQEALAAREAGIEQEVDWLSLRKELETLESLRGYSLYILGELCALLGDRAASRDYLERFLRRLEGAPLIKQLALKGELGRARALLLELSA